MTEVELDELYGKVKKITVSQSPGMMLGLKSRVFKDREEIDLLLKSGIMDWKDKRDNVQPVGEDLKEWSVKIQYGLFKSESFTSMGDFSGFLTACRALSESERKKISEMLKF